MARNVVSMGDINGSSGSYTFWNASTDVDLFYGLDGKCDNCSANTKLFARNKNAGFYEVIGSGEHVDDLLNRESLKKQFGMMWSSELELVDPIPSPSSGSEPVSSGIHHVVSSLSIGLVLTFTVLVALAQ